MPAPQQKPQPKTGKRYDTSWDARTQRMMNRFDGPAPRPVSLASTPRRPRRKPSSSFDKQLASKLAAGKQLDFGENVAGGEQKARRGGSTRTIPAKSIRIAAVMGGILSIMNASLNANLAPVLRAVADSGVLHSSELQLVAGAVVTVLLWEASSQLNANPEGLQTCDQDRYVHHRLPPLRAVSARR